METKPMEPGDVVYLGTPSSPRGLSSLAGHWQMHKPALAELLARINAADLSRVASKDKFSAATLPVDAQGKAQVSIIGTITDYPTAFDDWFGFCPASHVIEELELAAQQPTVKSVELFIDSPGGLATAGGMLAQAIAAFKKPITARAGGLVASAAYRAACQADDITASRDSMIGAIGTYTVLTDTTGMQEQMGVKLILRSSGGIKGAGADGNVTQELIDDVDREVKELNDLFVEDVAKGRGMKQTRARELADGRVHIASSAKSLGLIDAIESSTKENKNMNAEQFKAFADANPEDEAVRSLFAKGHKAGKAEGVTEGVNQERGRVVALFAAYPGKTDFIKSQIEKGADLAAAKADFADVLIEENKQLSAQLAEARKAPQASAGATPLPLAPVVEPAAPIDQSDPKAVASAEWDNEPEKRKGFSTKDRYVAIRTAELKGSFRDLRK